MVDGNAAAAVPTASAATVNAAAAASADGWLWVDGGGSTAAASVATANAAATAAEGGWLGADVRGGTAAAAVPAASVATVNAAATALEGTLFIRSRRDCLRLLMPAAPVDGLGMGASDACDAAFGLWPFGLAGVLAAGAGGAEASRAAKLMVFNGRVGVGDVGLGSGGCLRATGGGLKLAGAGLGGTLSCLRPGLLVADFLSGW